MSEKNESRDWELTCEGCDGDGFVYVERRVGPCQTDIQTFKEECECCEGRGFTIAFEDIPGIAEYVRKSRPAPSAPGDAQDERKAFEAWAKRKKMPLARIGQQYDDFWVDHAWNGWQARASLAAPAAGDALAALRELLECDSLKKRIASMQVCVMETDDDVQELDAMMSDLARRQPAAWDAARAALAAQVPHKGDAA